MSFAPFKLDHDSHSFSPSVQDTKIIGEIHLSKNTVVVGESFLVKVECPKEHARITINGVEGAEQYIQLIGLPGSRNIFVMATTSVGRIEYKTVKVVVKELQKGAKPFPVIQSTESRYTPRAAAFRIGNSNDTAMSDTSYDWDFGDGTFGTSKGTNVIEHDYTASLVRDDLTTSFRISVIARFPDGSNKTALRTIAMFNLYGRNKQNGILTPRASLHPTIWWGKLLPLLPTNVTTWTIDIKNLEDEEIVFTERRIELLDSSPDSNPPLGPPTTVDIVVGPLQTDSIPVTLPKSTFKGTIYGFAAHFKGQGSRTQKLAVSSMYVKVRNPLVLGGFIISPILGDALNALSQGSRILTHADIQFVLAKQKAPPIELIANNSRPERVVPVSGSTITAARQVGCTGAEPLSPAVLALLVDGGLSLDQQSPLNSRLQRRGVVIGAECDPDNVPDDLPEGTTCQFTGVFAWRFVPGQILNAKKGDVLLSPGGEGMIGQLLQNVQPPQHYSHSGIMTKNHVEVRHSTATMDWLLDHKAGSLLGHQGTEGFDPAALRYLWPGTVTQSIDHATYGELMNSPEGKTYSVSSFTFRANRGDTNTLSVPLVVKPIPHLETPDVRKSLHQIADAALGINGHYRFYAYTRPQLALEPSGVAPPEAGWAAGTLPTVCSSFIWLACQKAGIKPEGSSALRRQS